MTNAQFASDNYAPALPEVMDALQRVNDGWAAPYGADDFTASLQERFRSVFGPEARAFPVFNGTGANVVALRCVTRSHEAVICADTAHVNVDECGAPEHVGGFKLLPVATPDGKLTPELIAPKLVRFGDEHAVQPRVVTITQSTELGTLYTPDEIRALAGHAHAHDLFLHIDGARLANAAVALDCSLRAITTDVGVDLLSFGGTKNGALFAEAVVLLHADIGESAKFMRKQSMQLASKGRFLAAQLDALLDGDVWRRPAGHANAMARRLADAVRDVDGVTLTQEPQANALFAVLPRGVAEELQRDWRFYTWDENTGEVRWMCSWDTSAEDVDAFAAAVAEAVGAAAGTRTA
jgi:threonine aldolase